MSHDPEVTARIDHLLRTDPRLSAAARLIGRVPAVVSEPKPPRERRKTKAKKRPPPNIVEGEEPVSDDESGDDEAPAKPTGLPPWLKVARAKVVSEQMRLALGAEALAYVAIDGWLWGQLQTEALRDAALVLAVRGLRWEERESDGADLVKREQAPLQCHADTAHELSELVAALTEDPAEAATASNAAGSLFAGTTYISDEGDEDDGMASVGGNLADEVVE